MGKNRLLIVAQNQFGYHIDTYYYCKHLQTSFNINYICWDYDLKRIKMDGIKVIYVSRRGNIAQRNLRFLFRVIKELKKKYHFHIIKYFRGCSILKILFHKHSFLLDIRTSSVKRKRSTRSIYNLTMKSEIKFFKHVSVISKSLAQKLNLSKPIYILPLGAEILSKTQKTFTSIKLLYVGTLENRNIDHTIRGFSKFFHQYKNKIKITYSIIGGGYHNIENDLKELVNKEKVRQAVDILGPIAHDKIQPYFDNHNLGVSYIPQTEYFDTQPPTKTFEYLLSGMPVIATNTSENKAIITAENGILIEDTAKDFYQGLVLFYENKVHYHSTKIRSNAMPYTWRIIVADLERQIETIMKSNAAIH